MSESKGEKKYPRLEKLNTYPADSCLDTEKAKSWAKVCHLNRFPPHTVFQSADDFLEREGGREGTNCLKGSNKTMGI
jgi:hypothetical protein